ncbi:hypothetical protein ACFS4T_27350 [Pseudomonas lini]
MNDGWSWSEPFPCGSCLKTRSIRRRASTVGNPRYSSCRTGGTLEFSLTQLLFDRDHPGHYCRQISLVEIDLPVLTGPYEDVRATLLQISSMTATKATAQSVKYLHQPQGGVAPADVQVNLRSGQQVALSMGVAANGMSAMKPDEGLLNPFECTGVVSRWALNFPWQKKSRSCPCCSR